MAIQTEAMLKEFIVRRLGRGVIKVELTDEQLNDAVEVAKEFWQGWVGQSKAVVLTTTGTTEYPDTLIATDIDSVVEVVFPLASDDWTRAFRWAGVEINPFTYVYGGPHGGQGGYGELVQYMQYREMGKRIVSADRDWDWDETRRILVITPYPESGEKLLVYYISTSVELSFLKTYEYMLFRNYATAQAMKTLATIRMKYADKPSATGSFTMDGDALWANAEAIEQDTQEKMRQIQQPISFWAE